MTTASNFDPTWQFRSINQHDDIHADDAAAKPNQFESSAARQKTPRLPPFYREKPELWFGQVEALFELHGTADDGDRYNTVVSLLDLETAALVEQTILNPPPQNKYGKLKCNLIAACKEQLLKSLSTVDMRDKKPSEFLQELRNLIGEGLSEKSLRSFWLGHLPSEVQAIIGIQSDVALTSVAEIADKVWEVLSSQKCAGSSQAMPSAMPTPSYSTSAPQVLQPVIPKYSPAPQTTPPRYFGPSQPIGDRNYAIGPQGSPPFPSTPKYSGPFQAAPQYSAAIQPHSPPNYPTAQAKLPQWPRSISPQCYRGYQANPSEFSSRNQGIETLSSTSHYSGGHQPILPQYSAQPRPNPPQYSAGPQTSPSQYSRGLNQLPREAPPSYLQQRVEDLSRAVADLVTSQKKEDSICWYHRTYKVWAQKCDKPCNFEAEYLEPLNKSKLLPPPYNP